MLPDRKRFSLDNILGTRQQARASMSADQRSKEDGINTSYGSRVSPLENSFYTKHRNEWLERTFNEFSKKREAYWSRVTQQKCLPITRDSIFEWKYQAELLDPWNSDLEKKLRDRERILYLVDQKEIDEESLSCNIVYSLTDQYGIVREQFRIIYTEGETSYVLGNERKVYEGIDKDKTSILEYMADDLEGLHTGGTSSDHDGPN